jgi:predicted SnoaL-like aldol condensation-catalyzing enzyme
MKTTIEGDDGTQTVADRLIRAMRDADWTAVTDTYAADVLLDMNLPTWRFQLQGRDAARRFFAEQTGGLPNLHLVNIDVYRTSDGVIIEEEMRFDGDDGEYLWRAVDIFRIDAESVVEHTEYCTGCWPPDQIKRQAQEAPMVRW